MCIRAWGWVLGLIWAQCPCGPGAGFTQQTRCTCKCKRKAHCNPQTGKPGGGQTPPKAYSTSTQPLSWNPQLHGRLSRWLLGCSGAWRRETCPKLTEGEMRQGRCKYGVHQRKKGTDKKRDQRGGKRNTKTGRRAYDRSQYMYMNG